MILVCIAGSNFLPTFGPGEKPVLKAVCCDANVKANRYRSAGSSGGYDGVAASISRYLGPAHTKLWEMKASGELAALQRRRAQQNADEVSLELDGQCHPQLTCARETALPSSISDECGLAGTVCSHGQPLLGGFMAMPAAESLHYYDLVLDEMQQYVFVDTMYLDTGCTYSKHRQRHLSGQPAPARIRVPWWHARGHGPGCYLLYSGLYLPGGWP